MSSSSSSSSSSYDSIPDFGVLYDSVPAYIARADVEFYVTEALRANGPILELGCGTGRITIPIARAGGVIAGLDGSTNMLNRLRAKLEHEAEETRGRVLVLEGDARNFEVRTKFSLVIAPFRLVQLLSSIDDQLACLGCIARHLTPGGRLVFDVFNPYFAALTSDRSAEQNETPKQPLGDGRFLRRALRVPRVRWTEQTSESELIYYLSDGPDSPETRYVQAFDMRWFLPAEITHLLARAGFGVETIYGNFDRSPLTDGAPEQVVIAKLLS